MRKLVLATVVLMAVSVTTTACGGASKTDSAGGTAKATTSGTKSTTTSSTTPTIAGSSNGAGSSESPGGGSDPASAYCTALKGAKDKFKTLNLTGLDDNQFKQVTDEFDALGAAAPAAVKADWATVSSALKQVYQILANAGLSFNDLQNLGSGHLPKGVTAQDMARLGRQLTKSMQGSGFQAAATRITAEAKAECGVSLGG
ncbi:MAG: hypothetical protein QOD35_2485 [Nocardioidaceae bacterium]|nr:hypothetical protein [Nocardioidaceae bacterium]